MKRQKAKPRKKSTQSTSGQTASGQPDVVDAKMTVPRRSRREVLENLGIYGAIAAVVGGGGWYLIDDVMAKSAELDLSQIGNGIPTVVQIHDPECPRCRALQREARDAMADFDGNELQFLVANIRQADGRRLANLHGVGHVTLLLLDGEGNRQGVLVGENSSDNLAIAFRAHADSFGS